MARTDYIKEVRIKATPETIFPFLVEPESMAQWLGIADVEVTPGGKYSVHLENDEVMQGEFVEIDPPTRLVLAWGWLGGNHGMPPGSTTVEYSLVPDGDETVVTLTHRGIPEEAVEDHGKGWTLYMDRLAIISTGGMIDSERLDALRSK